MAELLNAKYDADKLPEGKLRFVSLYFFIDTGIMPICLALKRKNCLNQWSNHKNALMFLLLHKRNINDGIHIWPINLLRLLHQSEGFSKQGVCSYEAILSTMSLRY